jgi:hypothetical protein
MKIIFTIGLIMIAGIAASSCGVEGEQSSDDAQKKPRSTLIDAQLDSMKKAERVEDTVLKADQERKRQMQDL